MITLKKLKWSNCFSYGADNELDLDDATLTQIIGTNGRGKSSIPLIIEEALFNKNSKGIKKADIPNRYVNAGYDIYLSFTKDEDSYEITINRKANIKVKLEKNGDDISSHTATNTYKTIQQILETDFKTFSQLVYQHPNSSLQFLTATDTNRKKFLIDLLNLEEYVQLFEIFKEAARLSGNKKAAVESQIATIEKWLENNKLKDTTILPMLDIQIDTEEEEKELRHLTVELENISEKNKIISKNNKYIEILKSINIDEANNITASSIESYDSLQRQEGELKSTITAAKALLAKLNKLGDHCPTCEQDIQREFKEELISKEVTRVEEATLRIENEIQPEIERIKANNRDYERKRSIQQDWQDLYKSIDNSLPTSLLDRAELDERISRVRGLLQDKKSKLEGISRENQERATRNTRIQVIIEQTDKFLEDLESAKQALQDEEAVSIDLEILKKAFSTNGLIAYKIENLVKELENLVNKYLAELSDGRFTLQFVVLNDKLNVQITDNATIVDILALSSGELARVNTATLLAIRKLMSSISKSRLNILFLDEVTYVLDQEGKEKLVEVLLREDSLNTYIISHGWTHPLLEKIEIAKENNVSYLER